jgi:hypothetical protein
LGASVGGLSATHLPATLTITCTAETMFTPTPTRSQAIEFGCRHATPRYGSAVESSRRVAATEGQPPHPDAATHKIAMSQTGRMTRCTCVWTEKVRPATSPARKGPLAPGDT